LKIQESQKIIVEQYGDDVFHILNGQSMYDQVKEQGLLEFGRYAPFNEAMCEGNAQEGIFSQEFIACRCEAHHVTLEQYQQNTLRPLEDFFNQQFDCIVLWFGEDMFCQINLLTILAYLEDSNFSGKIVVTLVKEDTLEIIEQFGVDREGYKEIYNQVILSRKSPIRVHPPVLTNGIRLYLNYKEEENEITFFIKSHVNLSEKELLQRLFAAFPSYGLGDTQYLQLIRKHER